MRGAAQPFQEALIGRGAEQDTVMIANYDYKQSGGAEAPGRRRAPSCAASRAGDGRCYKATQEVLDELAGQERRLQEDLRAVARFRDDQNLWFRVAEHTLDSYRYGVSAAKK